MLEMSAKGVTQRINGALTNLARRKLLCNAALSVFSGSTAAPAPAMESDADKRMDAELKTLKA